MSPPGRRAGSRLGPRAIGWLLGGLVLLGGASGATAAARLEPAG